MSKRLRKGQNNEGNESGNVDSGDTLPQHSTAEAGTETEETHPSQPEPKRRSARLSLKPVLPAPEAAVVVDQDKPREQKGRGTRSSKPRRSSGRLVTAESPVTAAVGYTSDGMSFEDVTDVDDELFPDIVMESPSKERKYLKDDIVWAPYRDVFWPAIVTSVKLPNVCYLYINDSGKDVFRKHVKQLLPFDNPSKNLELKELGEKEGAKFKDAYELVIKYLVKRKQNSNLNARRFLTLNQNDKVAQAKTCLLRLTGSFDGFDNEEDKFDDEMLDHANGEDEGNGLAEPCDNSVHTDGLSPNEKAKVEEILKDLETVPADMTVSSEQFKEMEKEAIQLLEIIRSKDCSDHLMQIREGSIPSSRHKKYAREELMHSGLGPFTLFHDLTAELLTALDNLCDEHEDHPDYKQKVMLPEAIIYAITKLMDCTKLDAKRHFNKTCKKVGVQD